MTMEEIRARYPNPGKNDDSYCVGGALCLAMGGEPYSGNRFPSMARLSGDLRAANPELTEYHSRIFAYTIISKNDKGDIEGAWLCLKRALECKEEEFTLSFLR